MAVFLSLARLFSPLENNATGRAVTLYAQDPRFSPIDVLLFQSYGIEVLPKLDARDQISTSTLIFAPFLPWHIMLQEILLDRNPAICISSSIREAVEQIEIRLRHGFEEATFEGTLVGKEAAEICSKVGTRFLKGRKDDEFPEFELHSDALYGLRVYMSNEEDIVGG
jgi:hypothetical protein